MKIDPNWEHIYLYRLTGELCYPQLSYLGSYEFVLFFNREFDQYEYVKSSQLKKQFVIEQTQ